MKLDELIYFQLKRQNRPFNASANTISAEQYMRTLEIDTQLKGHYTV